jgi:CO/xanthine dehydrogenase Mo-binding subunit
MKGVIDSKADKYDGIDHLTGKTVFLDDWTFPGTLTVGVKNSEVDHGRLLSIEIERARMVPGILAIITAEDIPQNRFGFSDDQHVLAQQYVRYRGQPIVAVAGESVEAVKEAVNLIKIEYEELPAIFDPLESLGSKNSVHKIMNFITFGDFNCRRIRMGNVKQGFKEADHIFEHCYQTQIVQHAALETQSAAAVPEADGIITVYTVSQHLSLLREELSHVLKMPLNSIRVRGGVVGGGFGSKGKHGLEHIVSLLAIHTGRPVKWVWTRAEEFQISLTRAPHFMVYKTGVTRSGRMTAREVTSVRDTGAFNYDNNIGITKHALFSRGPYNIPNFSFDGYVAFTNRTPSAGMRGFGGPQAHFAGESQIDEIARELNWDPIDFRLKAYIWAGITRCWDKRLYNSSKA